MEKYNNINYTCQTCFKSFLKKSTLKTHKILCEFSKLSKREKQTNIEEIENIPSHRELFEIVQQLFIEHNTMKDKMKKMETFINTKLKNELLYSQYSNTKSSKKNTLEELNNTTTTTCPLTPIPSLTFDYWFEILLTDVDIITDDILFLLESYSVQEVVSIIISKYYYSNIEININNPIFILSKTPSPTISSHSSSSSSPTSIINRKNNVYIWDNEWEIMTEEKIKTFSKKIVSQLLKNISKWNITNSLKIRNDEKLGFTYMKIMNKLSSVPDNIHYSLTILSPDIFLTTQVEKT